MMRGMFAAISGLRMHQVMLDVTSNDIANVNTIGYKSARTTFTDALNQQQRGASGPGGGVGGSNAAQIGLGTQLGSIDNLMQAGDIEYTRAGNFATNSAGYLVTQDGFYVQGRTGAGGDTLLRIPPGSTNVAIGQNGEVSYVDAAGTRVSAGFISLATFSNAAGLERSGSNRWLVSANSGTPAIGVPSAQFGFTTSGAIEMSNVDLAQAFTNMITAQRGFQANSRVISTSDEMLQDLVNLKR
jgi:flagellar hook protein FlgE